MAASPPVRFAVLEHAWNGVHWDFLLERDGVLKTWALDELPAPGVVRDARPLPDHRRIYLDYEGPISGGRGTVRRVDGGEYEPLEWSESRIRVRLQGRQLVGDVVLTRRSRREEDGPSWKISLGNVD